MESDGSTSRPYGDRPILAAAGPAVRERRWHYQLARSGYSNDDVFDCRAAETCCINQKHIGVNGLQSGLSGQYRARIVILLAVLMIGISGQSSDRSGAVAVAGYSRQNG